MSTTTKRRLQSTGRQRSSRRKAPSASERTNFRIVPETKELIVRAAELKETTLSQFMIEASLEAAQAVLAERTRFALPEKQWKEFTRQLDAPPRRIQELAALLKGASVFEKE